MMQERLKAPIEHYYTPLHMCMYVPPNLTSIYSCNHFVVELFDAKLKEADLFVELASAPHFPKRLNSHLSQAFWIPKKPEEEGPTQQSARINEANWCH